MGMTFALDPGAAARSGRCSAEWAPLINSPAYDPRPIYAKDKTGVTVGMAMTEKQGGSDLRATHDDGAAGDGAARLRARPTC